jgi:hypothetical protein
MISSYDSKRCDIQPNIADKGSNTKPEIPAKVTNNIVAGIIGNTKIFTTIPIIDNCPII